MVLRGARFWQHISHHVLYCKFRGSSAVGIILSKSQQGQHQVTGKPTISTSTVINGGTAMENLARMWENITGYKLLFFTHALLSIPTFVCMRAFDQWTKKKDTSSSPKRNVRNQMINSKRLVQKRGNVSNTNEIGRAHV